MAPEEVPLLGLPPQQLRVFQIFFPYAFESYVNVIQRQTRFVQYTRAEAAIAMIRSKSVWLRKTMWMNDYREIAHGWELLQRTFQESAAGKNFKETMERAFPGIVQEIAANFDPWVKRYHLDTYVACVSEHDAAEDMMGRLSMWRAYGGRTGVAVVLKSAPFVAISHALGSYSSPVAYFNKEKIEAHFAKIAAGIAADMDFVKAQPRATIINTMHEAFRFGMICCKHPGFAEEREWRVIYNPERDTIPADQRPMQRRIEIINGTPQPVYSLPLKKLADGYDLEIGSILDRVIIGPSEFPGALLEAFWDELEKAGVPEPRKKVVVSDIPLRL
jgi:hypothetical protein